MLLVEQVLEKNNIHINYVRCPMCQRGRLCDKPSDVKVKTVVGRFVQENEDDISVIVKCPSCGQKFNIHLLK